MVSSLTCIIWILEGVEKEIVGNAIFENIKTNNSQNLCQGVCQFRELYTSSVRIIRETMLRQTHHSKTTEHLKKQKEKSGVKNDFLGVLFGHSL